MINTESRASYNDDGCSRFGQHGIHRIEMRQRILSMKENLVEFPDLLSSSISEIFDASHNGIVVIDRDGIINVYNKPARKIFSKAHSRFVGRHFSEIVPDAWPEFEEILKTGVPQIGKKISLPEATIIANRSPIIHGEQIVGVISIFQDISEYEEIISELKSYQELHRELEAIFESSYDGFYIADGKAVTIRVNKSYERITGLSSDMLVGKSLNELVAEEVFDNSVTLEVLNKKEPVTIMQEVRGGKQVMATGTPIFDDQGEIALVVTNVRDITELIALRTELDQSRHLSHRYYQSLIEHEGIELALQEMVVKSKAMMQVVRTAIKVASVDNSVLLQGESGVGKSMLARLIHQISHRKDHPFVKINCGTIPDSLVESELFGYEKGAFTGAVEGGKAGLFETGHTGTVFLDEIAELRQDLQVKLLEMIEEKTFKRVGGTQSISLDVRIIAATNKDLFKMVKEGAFREDLYYRLNVVPIKIPPLRQRREDIPPLVMKVLETYNRTHDKKLRLSQKVIDRLYRYDFPGNVRELVNVMERMMIMSENDRIGSDELPEEIKSLTYDSKTLNIEGLTLKESVQRLETQLIRNALEQGNSLSSAAGILGLHPTTLWRKASKYNLLQK